MENLVEELLLLLLLFQYVASLDGQIVSALVRGEGLQFLSRVSKLLIEKKFLLLMEKKSRSFLTKIFDKFQFLYGKSKTLHICSWPSGCRSQSQQHTQTRCYPISSVNYQ